MLTRICKQCKVEKSITEFHEGKTYRGGRKSICAECYNWNHRSEKSKQKELEKKELQSKGLKYCPHCKQIKKVSDFALQESRKDGLRAYCKDCVNETGLEYVRRPEIKQRKKEKESTREFLDQLAEYRRNSSKYKETLEKYRKTSSVHREYMKEYNKRFYVKVRSDISTRIWLELKLYNKTKESEFDEYLGCTVEYFVHYIELQFTEDMSWDKWGRGDDKFHIDHIIPCAMFDMNNEEEVKRCFHFSNYQPMWQPDNLRKSSKYNGKKIYKKIKINK